MSGYTGSIADAGRVIHIAKRRERHKQDIELKKRKIAQGNAAAADIGEKFAAHYDAIEQQLKSSTVGLVTLEEMKAARDNYVKEREKQLANKHMAAAEAKLEAAGQAEKAKKARTKHSCLSFDVDEDEDEEEDEDDDNDVDDDSALHVNARHNALSSSHDNDNKLHDNYGDNHNDGDVMVPGTSGMSSQTSSTTDSDAMMSSTMMSSDSVTGSDVIKKEEDLDAEDGDYASDLPEKGAAVRIDLRTKKLCKDPTVDTSFLPDQERDEEENRLREQLRLEWMQKQEKVKNEELAIAFSYWDGSGHRRDVKSKKGNTIHSFLAQAIELLRKDFNELKTVSADSLMFVKEDLIIPHFYTFHDFIVTKAVGKTGPLYKFDAAPELQIRTNKESHKTESHPAKVVLRSWYERNKHIYPASRWEPFDPSRKYDDRTGDMVKI